MTTIDVNVTGGVLPVPIRLVIDKRNVPLYPLIEKTHSFNEVFNLSNGVRTIRFKVKNPEGGNTVITISGIDSKGISFESKKNIEGNNFQTAIFKIVI